LALIALVIMIVARLATRGSVRFWKRVRRGAKATAIVTVALGLTGILAFDTMFQLFHELLFPGGNFDFDPATDRLVQLFPEQFWLETTLVLGGVIVLLAYLIVRWANRHIPATVTSPAVASGRTVAPGRPAG
jgi:integral membrane protein (TIGR01906 family)